MIRHLRDTERGGDAWWRCLASPYAILGAPEGPAEPIRIRGDAFADQVSGSTPLSRVTLQVDHDHDANRLLGTVGAGDLELRSGRDGIYARFRLPATDAGVSAAHMAARNELLVSTAFNIENTARGRDGALVVIQATLVHVALVHAAAWPCCRVWPEAASIYDLDDELRARDREFDRATPMPIRTTPTARKAAAPAARTNRRPGPIPLSDAWLAEAAFNAGGGGLRRSR